MAYGITYITTKGAILAAKTLECKKIQFTKFSVGDGTIDANSIDNIKELETLVNEVLNFNVTKVSRDSETQVTIRRII